jgi:hypothetical protein
MPLINTSVPNLIQGVSQQPNSARFVGQCEEQENALSSVAEGLKKRPNTRHVARLLQTAISENSFVRFIDRDKNEKYVVIHDGSKIQAWNILTGAEATINGATGGYVPAENSYLDTVNAREELNSLTVGDTTFLVNKTRTVTSDIDSASDSVNKDAFVFVKQGDYSKTYSIIFDENRRAVVSRDAEIINYQEGRPFFRNTFTLVDGGLGYTPNSEFSFFYAASYDVAWKLKSNPSGVITGFYNPQTGFTTTTFAIVSLYSPINFSVPDPQSGAASIGTVTKTTESSTFDSSSGIGARSTRIISELFNSANNNAGLKTYFDLDSKGNGIRFILKDSAASEDFFIRTSDDLSDEGLGMLYKEISSLSDLPLTAPNNFRIKIKGDADVDQDDYYVKFRTADGSPWSAGAWEESIGFDIYQNIDTSTMPMTLVNNAPDSFTIQEGDWDSRKAGDDDTNPMPSFVGKKITNMGLFKNRLVILSEDNIVFSEAGQFFNFFRTTTTSLLDSAPIDVGVNSEKVTNLRAAIGFQENLILFSDSSQFTLRGGDLLTPKTVSINPITNFEYNAEVDPLPLGAYIYYPFTRGKYTGLNEFAVNASTDVYESSEVTEHVPFYIPKNIIDISGSTSEQFITLLSGDEKNALYVYTYFWSNNQKVLSSWSKFVFTGDIISMSFVEASLYMVIANESETHLVVLPMEAGYVDDEGFNTLLDMRTQVTIPAETSSFTLPYKANADDDLRVYTKQGSLLHADHNQDSVQLERPVEEDTDVWVGLAYNMKYVFSEQVFKQQAENTKSPTNSAKTVIRNGSLFFDDTGAFTVKINSKHRDPIQVPFTSSKVGTTILNTSDLDSGVFRFSVGARPDEAVISVENDTALPCKFQSAEFESFAQIRSSRYS